MGRHSTTIVMFFVVLTLELDWLTFCESFPDPPILVGDVLSLPQSHKSAF